MTDELDLLRAGLADHYTLDREIGRGGMASVFLARDTRYDRRVAIKVLHAEVAEAIGADRFRQEIQVAARLAHPGILPVLDSGEFRTEDGGTRFWYSMSYVDGESLRDRLLREHQLPVDAAVSIAREVAEALDYAHRQGVIHRDVKPENILLQGDRPLLADFGIARVIDPSVSEKLTASGITLGTPAYMSPEQALADSSIDGRSDVYSLGCVLYETLTGEPPFTGATAQAIVARMMTDVPRAIAPVRAQAASLEPLVLKALARAPADRYATAGAMAAALRTGETVAVQPRRRTDSERGRWRRAALPAGILLVGIAVLALWKGRNRAAAVSANTARIVVLPFRTAGDSARAYFTSGMTGALRSKLASVPGIEVIAAASTDAAKDQPNPAAAARELGAAYALTGSVAWDSTGGGTIRVQPELIDARDGRVVLTWPSPVESRTRNVFDVEREITERIAHALNITLGAAVRARLGARFGDNPAAYELLLASGQTFDGVARHEMLLRAVALDPKLGPAWASIALTAVVQLVNSGDERFARETDTTSRRAIAATPDLAEAQLARGLYHRSVTLQHDSALQYVRRARELAPGSAMVAHFAASAFMSAGHLDEALAEARRGAGLDPKDASAVMRVGRALTWQKHGAEALEVFEPVWAFPIMSIPTFAQHDGIIARMATGDFTGARMVLATIPDSTKRRQLVAFTFGPAMSPQVVDDSLVAVLCRTGIALMPPTPKWTRPLVCAEWARRKGDVKGQHAAADSAVRLLRDAVRASPRHNLNRSRLAWALLLASDTTSALQSADSALALRPISRDAVFGAVNALEYAQIAAMAGDAGRAVKALDELLRKPSPMTTAWLKVDPIYNPIRGDARFQALLARP